MKKLSKIKLVGRSSNKLTPSQLSKLNGGTIGCGCCLCSPEYSASGAGSYTAQVRG